MKNQRITELINKKIDGIITPDESRELENYIASDAGVKRYQTQMMELSRRLENAESVNPPAELKRNVMSAIQSHGILAASGGSPASKISGWLKQILPVRPSYVFAYGIAAGLLLTMAAVSSFRLLPGQDLSELTGTIVLNKGGNDFSSVDLITISENHLSAKLETKSNGSLILATIEIDSPAELALEIAFNPEALSFEGFTQSSSLSGPVKISDRMVELSHAGDNRYLLVFEGRESHDTRISITLTAGDQILHRQLNTISTKNQ